VTRAAPRPRPTLRPRSDGTAAWSCAGSWRRFRFFLLRLGPDTPELNAEGVGLEQVGRVRVSFRSTEDRRKSRAFATDRAHLGFYEFGSKLSSCRCWRVHDTSTHRNERNDGSVQLHRYWNWNSEGGPTHQAIRRPRLTMGAFAVKSLSTPAFHAAPTHVRALGSRRSPGREHAPAACRP
jgi:hypothetical protein